MSEVRKRGFTLVELMVVLAVMSTVVVMSTVWIGRVFRFQKHVDALQGQHYQMLQLSRRFRDDVHRARQVKWIEEQSVALDVPGGDVFYQVKESDVIVTTSGEQGAGIQVFRLARNSRITFKSLIQDDALQLLVERPQEQRIEEGLGGPVDLHVQVRFRNRLDRTGDDELESGGAK